MRPIPPRLLLPALSALLGGSAFFCTPTHANAQGYTRYLTGNAGDAQVPTAGGGLLLAGGGTDVDAAMAWFKAKANGGDIVVLRASGSDGYNNYLFAQLPGPAIDSVETLVFDSRDAASNPQILQSIAGAEAIFFAGGDQSRYDDYWKGTPLEDAIHQRAADGAVLGGTSAGLAILGSSAYVAQRRSVTSDDTLANPFDRNITLEHDFLQLPLTQGLLTDSHFAQRSRQGRLLTMMARSAADTSAAFGYPGGFRGIGVNEETAVVVEPDGSATVLANGTQQRAAHLFTLTQPATTLTPNAPLTLERVAALEVRPGDTFNFHTFIADPGVGQPYSYDVLQGQLHLRDAIAPTPIAPAALPGDFDASGSVEQADLDLVLSHWGATTHPPAFLANNVGLSAPVNQDELDAVLTHWGNTTAPSSESFVPGPRAAAVPEPAATLALATTALALRRPS